MECGKLDNGKIAELQRSNEQFKEEMTELLDSLYCAYEITRKAYQDMYDVQKQYVKMLEKENYDLNVSVKVYQERAEGWERDYKNEKSKSWWQKIWE